MRKQPLQFLLTCCHSKLQEQTREVQVVEEVPEMGEQDEAKAD